MRLLITFLLLILSFSCLGKPIYLLDMRVFKQAAHKTRLVFNLDGVPATYKIFTLKSPYRLVIDLKSTKLNQRLVAPADLNFVKKIRSATRNRKDLRLVFDLKEAVRTKSFWLKPNSTNGHRLVIEVNLKRKRTSSKKKKTSVTSWIRFPKLLKKSQPQPVITKPTEPRQRNLVIAIDAGHGGIDSGAVGSAGVQEKNVVLAIAKEVYALVGKENGMRAVLIRNGDHFIKLRKRIELARQYKADLFVSIHADAYPDDRRVRGSSVYMLSRNAASSKVAKWLTKKENAADLIDGISLNDKDNLLAQVLLDLSMLNTLEASAYVGKSILKELKTVSHVHAPRLQRANFMVLSSPDIPSVLVETGFISNPDEEKKLNQPEYRHRLAKAIFEGIREYFANDSFSETLLVRR
jgi:N-acetylmuramoyl-L-alanine amidase